jgi:hypothetical protein
MSKKPNPSDLATLSVEELKRVFGALREADPDKLNPIGMKTKELIVKHIEGLGLSMSIVEAVAEMVLDGPGDVNLADCLDDMQLSEFAEAVAKANEKRDDKEAGPRGKGGRPSRAVTKDIDRKIVVLLSPKNPKKAGTKSHARFEKYVHGKSVAENLAIEGGMTRGDIAWDTAHGFVKLIEPGGEVPGRPEVQEAAPASE